MYEFGVFLEVRLWPRSLAGGALWNALSWTWHSCCTHELTAAVLTYILPGPRLPRRQSGLSSGWTLTQQTLSMPQIPCKMGFCLPGKAVTLLSAPTGPEPLERVSSSLLTQRAACRSEPRTGSQIPADLPSFFWHDPRNQQDSPNMFAFFSAPAAPAPLLESPLSSRDGIADSRRCPWLFSLLSTINNLPSTMEWSSVWFLDYTLKPLHLWPEQDKVSQNLSVDGRNFWLRSSWL